MHSSWLAADPQSMHLFAAGGKVYTLTAFSFVPASLTFSNASPD